MIIGLNDFLQVYENKKTVGNYRKAISDYLQGIYGKDQDPGNSLDNLSIRYIEEVKTEKRIWIKDLLKYTEKLKQSKAAYTVREYVRCVRTWIECNKIHPDVIEKRLIKNKLPIMNSELEEGELTKEKLNELYSKINSDECKCMFLIMAGSGSRIGETSRIKKSDIHFETYPVTIRIRAEYTKTKTARTIMITTEAAELLERICSNTEEEIFHNGEFKFRYQWKKINKESPDYELINGRRRLKYHPHMLRKWFLSEFSLHASREIAEHLAGHQGYLSKSYRRYNQEEIAAEFKKAEQYLSILNYNKFNMISQGTTEAYYEA